MNTSRGFVSALLLIVLFGLLALGGGIYLYKQQGAADTNAEKASTTSGTSTAPVSVAVAGIAWFIEPAYPEITNDDDYHKYFDKVAIEVTFADGTVKKYPLGEAPGCSRQDKPVSEQEGREIFGRVLCYFALSGTDFTAYSQDGTFVVEEYTDDPSGHTSGRTRVVLRLPEQPDARDATTTIRVK